jgi:hypothetical protein
MYFASSGGPGDGDDGYDDDPGYAEPPTQETRRAPGAPRAAAGGAGGEGGGRPRTVQFQPEERYWTEYLRIALPIIGLLLMIGLFWYWASQLAGDDNGPDEPIATQSPGTTALITPDSTPEPTEQVISQPTDEPVDTPAAPDEDSTPSTSGPATDGADDGEEPEPTEEPEAPAGAFETNQAVIVTEDGDGLNMRSDASTTASSLGNLAAGTVLEIQSGPIEADGYTWWEVIVSETGEVGFVAQEDPDSGAAFIEPAD